MSWSGVRLADDCSVTGPKDYPQVSQTRSQGQMSLTGVRPADDCRVTGPKDYPRVDEDVCPRLVGMLGFTQEV